MLFNTIDILEIPNGMPEGFFLFFAIIALTVIIYAIGYMEITKKKVEKIKKTKELVVNNLNKQKYLEDKN